MNNVEKMTDIVAKFVAYTAKKLPDDVIAKLEELGAKEDSPMARVIYETMFRNQELNIIINVYHNQAAGVFDFEVDNTYWSGTPHDSYHIFK